MTRGLVQSLSTCCGPEKKNDTCVFNGGLSYKKTDRLLEVVPALRGFDLRMRLIVSSFVGLAVLGLAQGCGHDLSHGHQPPPPPKVQLTPPTRQLIWGDINIIHTTDSHGWLLGHQKTSFPEPNYRCATPIPVILCQAAELFFPVLI